ncbi:MAG: hypothetical protein RR851_11030 [Clostridium sp.]
MKDIYQKLDEILAKTVEPDFRKNMGFWYDESEDFIGGVIEDGQ